MLNKKENPLWNLLFNIVIPVIILNKGHTFFPNNGPLYALLIALAFPFIYGLKDYFTNQHINKISILGLVGIALTGGLALFQFEGHVFAIKEAVIPLIIAVFIIGSVFYRKPVMSLFILNPSLFKKDLILSRLKSSQKEEDFKKLLNFTTFCLGGSFVLSAIMNFFVALWVFKDISHLDSDMKSQILNEQVADMQWLGYVLIALPLSLIMAGILWFLIKRLKKMTGLGLNEILSSDIS
ncbi:MAG: hypothetical protein OXB86_07460 [Bdellovibrionales bacterium]|nr:hypothetical protein [Bdellovibrionales bacterium]